MEKVKLDIQRCKGCYLCIENCPVNAIKRTNKTNDKGILTITVDQEKCVGCGNCYSMCPDLVFEIL